MIIGIQIDFAPDFDWEHTAPTNIIYRIKHLPWQVNLFDTGVAGSASAA
ncbi:hypothetical protein ACFX50_07465 [Neisseria meningitidis]